MCRDRFSMLVLSCLLSLGFLDRPGARAGDFGLDSVMYTNPDLPTARAVKASPPRARELWLKALERPEAEMQYQAAVAIADAHGRGMPGLESTIPALAKALERADEHVEVRLAAARALIGLNAQTVAHAFLQRIPLDGPAMRQLVEPALARWNVVDAREIWLQRLKDPDTPASDRALALRCLREVRETKATAATRDLLLAHSQPLTVRLEAARTLALLRTTGGEADASLLAAENAPKGFMGRLLAVTSLRHHQSPESLGMFERWMTDAEPTVAVVALERLVEVAPERIQPGLASILKTGDAKVREQGVEALFRLPSEPHLALLADRLDDPHPDVRNRARQRLEQLAAKPALKPVVLREGMRLLAANAWRGQEQAALLLVHLDHKPAAPRLVELLPARRPEAFVTAAWGLRRLAVPEMLPKMLEYVQSDLLRGRAGMPVDPIDWQLSHLHQSFGQHRYAPADAVLREFIPRNGPFYGKEERAAAIWALGLIHEGKPVAEIVSALEGRLNDVATIAGDEDHRVRRMSAVTIGRMKAASAVDTLRKYYRAKKPSLDDVNNACGWGIEQITGEKMPPAGTVDMPQSGWFLIPVD